MMHRWTIEDLFDRNPAWVAIAYCYLPIWVFLLAQALVIGFSDWINVMKAMLWIMFYFVVPFSCAVSIGVANRIIFNGRRRTLSLLQATFSMFLTYLGVLFPVIYSGALDLTNRNHLERLAMGTIVVFLVCLVFGAGYYTKLLEAARKGK